MADKMLIDATHPEETRVVVLRGNRVEEFDFESANRKQLRGNIYLAKVTRVEPSLQAAFVDYGGNRHGFLAFSEIHPDYYQIPVADRQALIAQEERDQRDADADADNRAGGGAAAIAIAAPSAIAIARSCRASRSLPKNRRSEDAETRPGETRLGEPPPSSRRRPNCRRQNRSCRTRSASRGSRRSARGFRNPAAESRRRRRRAAEDIIAAGEAMPSRRRRCRNAGEDHAETGDIAAFRLPPRPAPSDEPGARAMTATATARSTPKKKRVESVGGADALEEVQERMPRFRRQYKIQEVIKRRQVMLVQVVKEERGTKGAALTTYLSLAGRYSVLMPNTSRGGGISRKITSAEDRTRLKEIAQDLEVPEGMGVILRTAGASRTKIEVKRDFEYLLRLWETVRDLTLKSTAPKLVYEEGSLTKRSIRDLYGKDIEEIVVSGEEGYKEAREFMRMLMPSHAKHVKHYKDTQPLFTRYGIESQLDAMFSPSRAAALRRLHRDQPGRSAGRDRRQLRARHARAPHRGHRAQDQLRGGGGNRAPTAPARPRRPDRHRLHRHG